MAKRTRHYGAATRRALTLVGSRIALERREQRRTQADLAERAGISAPTLGKIERGSPGTEIGIVFEVATLLGIELFPDTDQDMLAQRLMLSPRRIDSASRPVVDTDF